MDFLKNLALDRWYKPMIATGIFLLPLSIYFHEDRMFYFGVFLLFFGLGEWRTHSEFYAPLNAYWNRRGDVIQIERNWTLTGIVFYILSLVAFILLALKVAATF